eukprot:gene7661-5508_t
MEADEHELVFKYIHANDTVLETGGRFGTTSCVIAQQLENSGNMLTVEPDHRVWDQLEENRASHKCSFWLLRGVIGTEPVIIEGSSYATRSVQGKGHLKSPVHTNCGYHPDPRSTVMNTVYTFEQIQVVTQMTFSALLIDCEGCIDFMFRGNTRPLSEVLANVRTILLEGDMPIGAPDCTVNCVDYDKWVNEFVAIGFVVAEKNQDKKYPWIYHYAFVRK